jgi:hypothetical protein
LSGLVWPTSGDNTRSSIFDLEILPHLLETAGRIRLRGGTDLSRQFTRKYVRGGHRTFLQNLFFAQINLSDPFGTRRLTGKLLNSLQVEFARAIFGTKLKGFSETGFGFGKCLALKPVQRGSEDNFTLSDRKVSVPTVITNANGEVVDSMEHYAENIGEPGRRFEVRITANEIEADDAFLKPFEAMSKVYEPAADAKSGNKLRLPREEGGTLF